jgi:hypothetical protein
MQVAANRRSGVPAAIIDSRRGRRSYERCGLIEDGCGFQALV